MLDIGIGSHHMAFVVFVTYPMDICSRKISFYDYD